MRTGVTLLVVRFLMSPQLLVRRERLWAIQMFAPIWLRPRRRVCGGNMRSEMMVFRKSLRAARLRTLKIGHSAEIL